MVFSGIVQEMGRVVALETRDDLVTWDGKVSKGTVMTIGGIEKGLVDAYEGCSIAINGVCLTAKSFDVKEKTAVFGLAPETLRRTNLKWLKVGDPVNIEPSLKVSDRNSGHYVQGHVDATAEILSKTRDGESLRIRFGKLPSDLMPYIVEKGYVAVDGTSLTVTAVDVAERWFELMLIEHTQKAVVIPLKPVGGAVNIEVDIMAKYSSEQVKAVQKNVEALRKELRSLKGTLVAATAIILGILLFKRK